VGQQSRETRSRDALAALGALPRYLVGCVEEGAQALDLGGGFIDHQSRGRHL
jgi:hypothetical protein